MHVKKRGRGFLARITWGIDSGSEFTGFVCSIGIFASSVIVVHEVIVRYLRIPTVWQTELAVYLLMMATYVGAAYTQKYDGHISIDLVTNLLKPRQRAILLLIVSVVGIIVAGVIAWYSWPMWVEAVGRGYHSESLWGPPLVFPYILLPLGMSFLVFQYIVYIAQKIKLFRELSGEK